jgi:hypothetical protein
LPTTWAAASVSDLIADINAANKHGGSNTIALVASTTFTLTAVDNTADGATGLPVIKKGDNLTILGNGATIERSTASGTPAFRLFDVASGGSLTLENLTLQNGLASGSGAAAQGGAISNQGTLVLNAVTVQNNVANGSPGKTGTSQGNDNGGPGGDAAGGGIWSNGALTLATGTKVQGNRAVGGPGGDAWEWCDPIGSYCYFRGIGGTGGNGFGGGVYVAGGTASLTGATLSGNTALGGYGGLGGGNGGNGFSGGLYVAVGTVSLCTVTVASNTAQGGSGGANGGGGHGSGGAGYGGGFYIAAGATVYLDAFTLANTGNNKADSYADIDGSYILQGC